MLLGGTAGVLAPDPDSQTVLAAELRGSGLRMTGAGAAIAGPLPALDGSSGITTFPAKSMPEASSARCPLSR